MVLVDTSIWISLYRKRNQTVGQKLWSLVTANQAALCGQIWVEYLGGFRKERERDEHKKALQAFPFLETSRTAYELAIELSAKHPSLGAGDAIIGATAIVSNAALFTADKDFHHLSSEGLILF